MLLGEGRVNDVAAKAHWADDDLSECLNKDALWGFTIRASGELEKTSREWVDDPVLYCLFVMIFAGFLSFSFYVPSAHSFNFAQP